jgi:hypothetical protein
VIGRRDLRPPHADSPVTTGYREARARSSNEDYKEQAQSYRNMESAADMAAAAEKKAAVGAGWGAALKFGGVVASLFTGGVDLSKRCGLAMPEGEGGGFLGRFGGAG